MVEKHDKDIEALKNSGAGPDHERRISNLERYDLGVIDRRLDDLTNDVVGLKRSFYTFAFSVVGSAIVFAFTVFALLGK
jgi:predicted membrane chloride channel (bestrophin family)